MVWLGHVLPSQPGRAVRTRQQGRAHPSKLCVEAEMAVKGASITRHAALVLARRERGQSCPMGNNRDWEEDCFCLFSSNAMQREV